jgi:hypothetical protein
MMDYRSSVHFYLTLKDDFIDRVRENESRSLFDELENPYLDARERLTPGKIYPVMKVTDEGRHLTVIDDQGHPWTAVTGLFKFAERISPSAAL